MEEFIEKGSCIYIKQKTQIFEHILYEETNFNFIQNNLCLMDGIAIDETGFFGKGLLFKTKVKGELELLDFTEEGIKGILKFDCGDIKYEGEVLNSIPNGKGKLKRDD